MMMPQNTTTHRMSPSNMQYAQIASNGYGNNSHSPTMPRADFSPLPYTGKYASNAPNPPPIALHDPNTMYHADQSYAAYQERTKRVRSSTAPQLEPYHGGQPSQPPNMPNMYNSSQQYNNTNAYGINEQNAQSRNASTPPPMTAKQVHTNYYNNMTLPALPTRTAKSKSFGGAMLGSEHAPPSMSSMQKTTSLPADKYQSKVPDLPSNESNYFMMETPNDLGMRKRHYSRSEPLRPEKAKFDMISNNIWRTNSPQDKDAKNANQIEKP